MTLVDDQVAVLGHAIIDDTLPDEALNDGDVEQPGRSASAAADATDRLRGQAEERREPFDPLVEQLTSMHEHERADAALCDQPGGDHRLAERRRGSQAPVSCASIASAATCCSGRSLPWKLTSRGRPAYRSSRTAMRTRKSLRARRTSSTHPRGRLM